MDKNIIISIYNDFENGLSLEQVLDKYVKSKNLFKQNIINYDDIELSLTIDDFKTITSNSRENYDDDFMDKFTIDQQIYEKLIKEYKFPK